MERYLIEIYQTGSTKVTGLGKLRINNIIGRLKNEGIKVAYIKTRVSETLKRV